MQISLNQVEIHQKSMDLNYTKIVSLIKVFQEAVQLPISDSECMFSEDKFCGYVYPHSSSMECTRETLKTVDAHKTRKNQIRQCLQGNTLREFHSNINQWFELWKE
jgi:hypothetical protein